MKKTIFYSLFSALFMLTSCSMFEIDNYEEPAETIWGEVVDEATGKRVLTDQGSEGIRVRLTELSWGDNVQHNPDFYCMMDGTFQNTKLFKGEYNVRIDGPFIPLVRENTDGTLLHDGSVNTEISGTTKVKFEVQPFLNVEFVGDPQVGNWKDEYLNVTDIQFFVSYSNTVGYRARDERWSSSISYEGKSFEDLLGKEVIVQSNGSIPSGRKVFVRAAARINYDTPVGSGTRRWNYSEPVEVLIP